MSRDDPNNHIASVTDQGKEARKLHDDDSSPLTILPQDCPYGPGDLRDAWMKGYGASKEEVLQADTSEPTTQDVRTDARPKTVREGAIPRRSGGRGKKADAGPAATKVSTETTGNAETSLVTKSGEAQPEQSSSPGGSVTTTVGDPRATEGDRTAPDPKVVDGKGLM